MAVWNICVMQVYGMSIQYEKYIRHVTELYKAVEHARDEGDKDILLKKEIRFQEAIRIPQFLLDPCECVKIYDGLIEAITGTGIDGKEEQAPDGKPDHNQDKPKDEDS
jgi:hypothetical protein